MHTPRWAHYFTVVGYVLLTASITAALAVPVIWRVITMLISAVVIIALIGPLHSVNEAERGEAVAPYGD